MPPHTPPQMAPKPSPPYHFQPLASSTTRPMKQGFPTLPLTPGDEPGHGPRRHGLLRPHQRTNPAIWCGAIVCVIFSLLLILAGIATLIIFLVIKPKNPVFEITSATLNSVYLDSPAYFNGDFTFLANFSNPNTRIDVMFEYLSVELYFSDRLIAAQGLQPFAQRRGETSLGSVHMITSEVYLPPDLTVEIQKQVRSNRVAYSVRGTFRVRASFGIGHYSYWLYGRCELELTSPPGGVLVARSCRTKR